MFPGDMISKYYFPVLIIVGTTGNILSFLVIFYFCYIINANERFWNFASSAAKKYPRQTHPRIRFSRSSVEFKHFPGKMYPRICLPACVTRQTYSIIHFACLRTRQDISWKLFCLVVNPGICFAWSQEQGKRILGHVLLGNIFWLLHWCIVLVDELKETVRDMTLFTIGNDFQCSEKNYLSNSSLALMLRSDQLTAKSITITTSLEQLCGLLKIMKIQHWNCFLLNIYHWTNNKFYPCIWFKIIHKAGTVTSTWQLLQTIKNYFTQVQYLTPTSRTLLCNVGNVRIVKMKLHQLRTWINAKLLRPTMRHFG